jgi:hypothetical protein
MQRFICDICGYNFEMDTDVDILPCPVCKGKCITEHAMQEKEEMAKMIDEDKGDDDFTPEQDSTEEAVDLIITQAMEKNLQELGNNKLYQHIEGLTEAKQRARYRKFFLLVGGHIPVGETIKI